MDVCGASFLVATQVLVPRGPHVPWLSFSVGVFPVILLLFEDDEHDSSDPNKTHDPHLSSLPHLLFLYGVGNQYVVITMAIFDSATFEDL